MVDVLDVAHQDAHRVLGGLVGVTGDYAKSKSVSGLVGALLSTNGQGLRSIMPTCTLNMTTCTLHIDSMHPEHDNLHTAH